jgi:hypothetical protein
MMYDLKDLYTFQSASGSHAQVISTSAAAHTFASTNYKDHGPLASGNSVHHLDRANLWLNIRVVDALVSTNVGTMAVTFVTANDTAFTGSSVAFTPVAAAVASVGWAAGQEYSVPFPKADYGRYSRLHFTGATHIITAGSVIAVLADEPGRFTAFDQDASVFN